MLFRDMMIWYREWFEWVILKSLEGMDLQVCRETNCVLKETEAVDEDGPHVLRLPSAIFFWVLFN